MSWVDICGFDDLEILGMPFWTMDSNGNDFFRVLNLIFILDDTEDISDEDYVAACDFLNSFRETMVVDGMDTDVRVVVAPTGGEIVGPIDLDQFKWDGHARSKGDVKTLFAEIPKLLRDTEHLGASYIVDNVIIYLSNGKFIDKNPRPYIDICRNWRYTRTPKLIITFSDDRDERKLADIVGSKNRVFGRDVFDNIKFYVLQGGVELHKIHEVAEIPTVYAGDSEYKVDRRAEEHEAPVEDVYDM